MQQGVFVSSPELSLYVIQQVIQQGHWYRQWHLHLHLQWHRLLRATPSLGTRSSEQATHPLYDCCLQHALVAGPRIRSRFRSRSSVPQEAPAPGFVLWIPPTPSSAPTHPPLSLSRRGSSPRRTDRAMLRRRPGGAEVHVTLQCQRQAQSPPPARSGNTRIDRAMHWQRNRRRRPAPLLPVPADPRAGRIAVSRAAEGPRQTPT